MLKSVVGFGLRTRFIVVFASTMLLIVGALQLNRMSFDLLPEFTPPEVEVQTEALGLAAAEVEALITVQLEEILGGVPWLESMESKSIDGLSSIVMKFEPGTDIMDARQLVQERLLRTAVLPKVAKRPLMLQPVSSLNRVLNVGLSSQSLSLIDISVLARWKIKPRLMGLPGVANVAIWGQRERQLQVLVDPATLADKGVQLIDVIQATGNALYSTPLTYLQGSTPGTGGFIDMPNQRLDIRHVLPVSTPDQLAQVAFTAKNGQIMRLGEVANVVEGHPILIGDGMVDEKPALTLVVEKFPWANTRDVTRQVEMTLKTLAPGLTGLEINAQTFRPASFIDLSISNLRLALIIGAALAIAAVALGLFQWRAALIGVLTMGLSLATALVVLAAFGLGANALVLAGLVAALSLTIHDAVGDVHRIAARLRENATAVAPQTSRSVILAAVTETKGAALSGTLVVVLVMLPVLTLGGLFGTFSQPVILAFLVMTLSSIAVALIAAPALALVIMPATPANAESAGWLVKLRARYGAVLSRQLAAPGAVVGLTALVLSLGLMAALFVGHSLYPQFQERDFLMRWQTPPGTSHAEISRQMAAAGQAIRAIPGVRDVGAQMGRALESDRVEGISSSELWVSVDPAADFDATVTEIQNVARGFPGLEPQAVSFSADRIAKVRAGQDGAIVLRTFGPDQVVLGKLADDIRKAASGIDGIAVQKGAVAQTNPVLEIKVNLAGAEKYGLSPGEIRRNATTLLAALEVGTLYEDQKMFEVVVWGVPEIRDDLSDVGSLLIDTPNGGHVPLSEVADVRLVDNPTVLVRHNSSIATDLGIVVSGRDQASAVAELKALIATIDYPLEYHSEIIEAPTELQAHGARLLAYGLAAAGAILLLLQAATGSWRSGAAAMLMLPAALAGGVLASLLVNGVLSLGSLIGLVALIGIAARDMLLFTRDCRTAAPLGAPTVGVILSVAVARFEPIVLTAIAIAFLMLPTAILGARPGLELLHPMAVTLLGGLVTTALVSLVLWPVCLIALRAGSLEAIGKETDYAVA